MVAESPVMREKLEFAERIAATNASVLLIGETGVGKATMAAWLHGAGNRAKAPFVPVNCAALAGTDGNSAEEALAVSRLFGGTGAQGAYPGSLERADTGTVFFEEISDLSLPLQGRLLEVLENKAFSREGAGGPEEVPVNACIMASTVRSLEDRVQAGLFRRDLYFRLNVLPFYIPPLRERRQDILPLANRFLRGAEKTAERQAQSLVFSESARKALEIWRWPGNVQELRNRVERSVLAVAPDSTVIDTEQLFPAEEGRALSGNSAGTENKTLKEALDSFKRSFIEARLSANNWNVTLTAGELDIQRTYLSRLLKELGIEKVNKKNAGLRQTE